MNSSEKYTIYNCILYTTYIQPLYTLYTIYNHYIQPFQLFSSQYKLSLHIFIVGKKERRKTKTTSGRSRQVSLFTCIYAAGFIVCLHKAVLFDFLTPWATKKLFLNRGLFQ